MNLTLETGYGGTVLQMQPYKKSFGRCLMQLDPKTGTSIEVCSQTALQQSLVSLTLIFVALGGALSGVVGNYFGRRGTIQSGAFFAGAGSLAVSAVPSALGSAAVLLVASFFLEGSGAVLPGYLLRSGTAAAYLLCGIRWRHRLPG